MGLIQGQQTDLPAPQLGERQRKKKKTRLFLQMTKEKGSNKTLVSVASQTRHQVQWTHPAMTAIFQDAVIAKRHQTPTNPRFKSPRWHRMQVSPLPPSHKPPSASASGSI